MPKQNLTQYAVLGLLDLSPRTGYDIKQFVEENISHFWNESYRWIYTTLDQLDADGLASARAEDRGERERVVYRITKKGQRALQDWLAEPAKPLKIRDEMLLKVLFGHAVPARISVQHVKRHQELMLERHHELDDLERELPGMDLDAGGRQHLALTLGLSRRVAAAHLKWCEDALKQLQSPRRKTGTKRRTRTR